MKAKAAAEAEGRTAVAVAWDGEARVVLVVADTVKPASAEAAGLLNPMIAGAAMALSSVFVVSNSLRLRGFSSTASTTAAPVQVSAPCEDKVPTVA